MSDRSDGGPERTADGRYIVVKGRRWRATDPGIPEELRSELVSELMAARRAVGHAGDDAEAERAARSRVHDAKVALGERGHPWWEPPTDEHLRDRLAAVIRTLLRSREHEASVGLDEAAQVVAAGDRQSRLDLARRVAETLSDDGVVDLVGDAGPVRVRWQASS